MGTKDTKRTQARELTEAEIAELFRDDCLRSCAEAPIPSAGLVWWRASIRARAEAARKAEKPLTLAPAMAGAVVLGAACGIAGLVWHAVPALPHLSTTVVMALGLAVCFVVAPLALVLTFARE